MDKQTLIIVIAFLLIHWIADFILQTDEQAKGKSKEWKFLLSHTLNYSGFWVLPICIIFGLSKLNWSVNQYVINSFLFSGITLICHTITDYFTSRLNAKLWKEQKVHLFFVSVGFDQILHYVQLFLTYYFLTT